MEPVPSGSQSESIETPKRITRKELYLVLKSENYFKCSSSKCNERLFRYILHTLDVKTCAPETEKCVKTSLKFFLTKLFSKWRQCNRMHDRLLQKHCKWFQKELELSYDLLQVQPRPSKINVGKGRPKKHFCTASLRTQQRNVQALVDKNSPEQLTQAAETSLVKAGRRRTAKLIKIALQSSPKSLNRMTKARSVEKSYTPYTPVQALGLIVSTGMTKEGYILVQRGAKAQGANIYPSYDLIKIAKKACYPGQIYITEFEATICLQYLLDHTVKRLMEVQQEVLLLSLPQEIATVDIYYKWGLDGSGGHSIYKQHFANNSRYADSNIVLSTLVPLEISVNHNNKRLIFWKNTSTSSTRYCRPISFKLAKETNETTKEEYNAINNQFQTIENTIVHLKDEKNVTFKHIAICTMMDGKTCNVLTDTASSQSCNICKATPKDMNDIDKVLKRPCNTSAYRFGISVLHAYLRCFEFLLHISYKLDLKQWQARGKSAQDEVTKRKTSLQILFYDELGLVVDQPKQGGGNTNDGNTAKKFFNNATKVAVITGLDEDLITRFGNILKVISSGHYVNVDLFKEYCLKTAKKCVDLYGWYKMSASVHKLLIHGSEIIASLPLPVGQLSEDVIEASQKEFKNIRRFHTRKTSRVDTNEDIIHWMLVNSDPLISAMRPKPRKAKNPPLNVEVIQMLTVPSYLRLDSANDETEEVSDDDYEINNDDD